MAWAKAFYALAQGLKPGDRILTGMVEYGANYVAMLQVRFAIQLRRASVYLNKKARNSGNFWMQSLVRH